MIDRYATQGLEPRCRITPSCDPATGNALEQRGFSVEDPVPVTTRSLPEDERADEIGASPAAIDDRIASEVDALGSDRFLVDDLTGVFEMAVRPDRQSRHHAKNIVSALHAFGYQGGVEHVYLQVVEDNGAAVGLHRSMGYEVSHRYRYRCADLEGT